MKYIEVEPMYVSDHVLDMINSEEIVVRNFPGRHQSLFVPETLDLSNFDPSGQMEGEVLDILKSPL